MFSRIKSLFFIFGFIITIILVIFAMTINRKNHKKYRKVWARIQRFLIGYKPIIHGKIDENANLLVINHQSMLDIIALEDIYPLNIAWCAKKELFEIPFFSRSLKLSDMISINRNDKRAIVKLLNDTKDRLKHNRVIAIFPEGTRGNGEKLLPFQQGTKIIAEKLNLKIQPVVMNNAKNIFDMKHFKINSGKLNITFMPIVNPKTDKNWYENLYESMQYELDRLKKQN